ncbi:hypothetical protein [Tumebacillus flagellatus]|uniref:dUTPase n=1 Tax=Tumebacillus flagellatus TaxID=1157490 RepID=A0A074LJS4_9BACL|nr:hypothetical protein [Tumebacillus flagellatus]KEO80855.1 hypothetical protein EL26_24045 [Tumebacillus flagellatus]
MTTLQLPDLYKAAAELVALQKEKNNLTGDLLPRMVLELNVKLGKLAELAGMGEWHRTREPLIEQKLGLTYAQYRKVNEGQMEWPTRNPLMEACAEVYGGILSIAAEAGYTDDDCSAWDDSLEGDNADCINEMIFYLNYFRFEQESERKKEYFRHVIYMFANTIYYRFTIDWDDLFTAVMESIERQRRAVSSDEN